MLMHNVGTKMLIAIIAVLIACCNTTTPKWKRYPFMLEHAANLTFPEVEGAQYEYQSDSWFFTAQVTGESTGNKYQLVTIFDRNYITAGHFDFYQASIFDYRSGAFSTFTQYDIPPVTQAQQRFYAASRHLDTGFKSSAGSAYFRNGESRGQPVPFVYELNCPGTDLVTSEPFHFKVNADMQRKPVAVGASTLKGVFTFYAQPNTLTYFDTRPLVSGVVTFKNKTEKVHGTVGHIDRQIFPLYSGIYTPTGRQHSHEWRQINLDNGYDLAIWRQFDRVQNNTVIETSGSTVSRPNEVPLYADGVTDLTVEYISYAKYPRDKYSTLIPPPSQNMWMPSEHIIRSQALRMELHAVYTTKAPVAQLPIEYFEGPAIWTGSLLGTKVSGVGIFESTLGLYRDWELADVLFNTVSHLPASRFTTFPKAKVVGFCKTLQSMVSSDPVQDNRVMAREYATAKVIPALKTVRNNRQILEIAQDFLSSLTIIT